MENNNKVIAESSISRIYDYIKNFECATISASRGKITNVTENTFVPPDYENERTLISPKELDIVIPELKLAIEFNRFTMAFR